jgi:multiple sugar transport system ATP-binding protein
LLPKDRDIAMVFQNYAIYPHMSVYNNMAFGLKQRKYPKSQIAQRVQNAARILGIEALVDRRPKTLSGGQRQRVALGRAIVREPAVFLFDEPLSNLDAKMRVEMRKEIKLLHQRLQATMIYVTHDQVEAMTLGDRVCVMNRGHIEQVGLPIEVYDHPRTRFVAAFVGTPPMNFLPGKLCEQGDQVVFKGQTIEVVLPRAHAEKARGRIGAAFELGIRPEDLEPPQPGAAADSVICGDVQIVEALGSEQLVYITVGDSTIIARYDSHISVKSGDRVQLSPKPAKLHLFDCVSGENLMEV